MGPFAWSEIACLVFEELAIQSPGWNGLPTVFGYVGNAGAVYLVASG